MIVTSSASRNLKSQTGRRSHIVASAATAVAISLTWSSPAVAGPIAIDGDPVLFWTDVLSSSLTPPPPLATRSIAMVSVAIYDAVNASLGSPNTSYLKVSTPGGDTRVAASVAAHDVLVNLFPAKAADFGTALSQQLAQVPDGAAKSNGIVTGGTIAAAMLAQRANDGITGTTTYAPQAPGTPGHWQPTPPLNAAFAFTQLGTVDPWLIESGSQFRPGAPPALDSAEYAAAFNEVKELGSAISATRTADQTAAAQFWATQTPNPMLRLALALTENRELSTLENARVFALMSSVMADAVIAAWDSKLHYDYWRPVTAIHDADLDGNPLTIADSQWTSLIGNPPYPGYTSGLMSVAGSSALTLQSLLGNDFGFCLSSNNGSPDRCWDNFDDLLTELTENRVWAGIHFDFDMLAGLEINRGILRYALAGDAFDAVPEPGMIGLFGLGAAALLAAGRRRMRALPT
jgi:hypothetical protein